MLVYLQEHPTSFNMNIDSITIHVDREGVDATFPEYRRLKSLF